MIRSVVVGDPGIFTNYWWDDSKLDACLKHARARRCDVFVGVDVWARGTAPHGPGKACAPAVAKCHSLGLSVALFAPGWTMEAGPAKGLLGEDAAKEDRGFWAALGIVEA